MIISKKRMSFLYKNAIIIFLFALIYSSLPPNSFNKKMDLFDSVYYSIVTHVTLGYGDYHPVSKVAKFFSALQAFIIFYFITEEFVK